ncbi:MAG: 2-hydroxy-6-oxonona-2,4-dienedioate hydrolase [Limisphaerales bacterium]|jgi:2-hydroxy-6-oxonona-2,4-dienedioate hydrolase
MEIPVHQDGEFSYVEEGEGPVLIALHGLFGALSNFRDLVFHFQGRYKVVIPMLPLYSLPTEETNLKGYVLYIERFIAQRGYGDIILLGNSLGGHIGLIYALQNLDRLKGLILTGSSGLFENTIGNTFPKKGDYQFIKEKTELTFYDPKCATKELVDELFDIVNDREKALRIIYTAKSAIRNNLSGEVHKIGCPTLLIWGKQDSITPPFVGEEFEKLMPNAELVIVDKCGHAPMMERPKEFNKIMDNWLTKLELVKS